jgi:hypothetical protein
MMADADGKDPTPAYVEKITVSFPDGYDPVASEGRGCEMSDVQDYVINFEITNSNVCSLLIRPRFNNVHDDQKKGSRNETEVRKRKDIAEQKGIN